MRQGTWTGPRGAVLGVGYRRPFFFAGLRAAALRAGFGAFTLALATRFLDGAFRLAAFLAAGFPAAAFLAAAFLGAAFLTAATLAGALGWHAVALALGATVAALALLAATTGLCVGCLLFKGLASWRGTPLSDAVASFAAGVCVDCQCPGPGRMM